MADSPWSDLGIGPTADREKIFAAYRAKVDKLGLSSPISAYTRLNESRDKALVLAKEIGPAASPTRRVPRVRYADRAESQERAAQNDGGDELKWYDGQFATLLDGMEARGVGGTEDTPAPDRFKTVIERARLIIFLVFAAIYAGVALWHLFEPEVPVPQTVIALSNYRPAALDDKQAMARVSAALPELLGPGLSIERLEKQQPSLTGAFAQSVSGSPGEGDMDNLRSVLRSAVVHSRASLDRQMLLEASSVYLTWLRAADRANDGSCRDVTGHSFFDGYPVIEGQDLVREHDFERKLMENGQLYFDSDMDNKPVPPIPDWAVSDAVAKTGMVAAQIRKSFADLTDPAKCKVTIAVLEALLAHPNDAPGDLLEVI